MRRHKGMAAAALALLLAGGCSSTGSQQSAGEYLDDSVVTARVKSALIADPVTKARQINVETFRGVVQLSGFVDNTDEKTQATEVAQEVSGVTEVRNDLQIKPQASASDSNAVTE